jgi:hypothetical protein
LNYFGEITSRYLVIFTLIHPNANRVVVRVLSRPGTTGQDKLDFFRIEIAVLRRELIFISVAIQTFLLLQFPTMVEIFVSLYPELAPSPQNFRIVSKTARSVTVRWEKVAMPVTEAILHYVVQYRAK